MSDGQNTEPNEARRGLTRREFLGLAAGGAGAALTAGWPTIATGATTQSAPTTVEEGFASPKGLSGARYAPTPKQTMFPMIGNGIIPRAAWTSVGPAKPCHPMDGVSLITFHHDGDPGGFYEDKLWETAAYLERIRAYHVQKAFEDIGYHYAIDRAGFVWQLRPVQYRGEHVRNGLDAKHQLHKWNDHNVGVVVLGNFMLQSPTDAQKARICTFGAWLRKQYHLPIAQVKVHQELVTTECPGVQMRPYMDHVRTKALI